MPLCPCCGSDDTREVEKGAWYCFKCKEVTYYAPEFGEPDFDIEDFVEE